MDSIWLLLHEGHLVIMSLVLQLVDCDAHQKHDSQSKKRIDIVNVEDLYYICSWEALLMYSYAIPDDSYELCSATISNDTPVI
jgi:hypothetical protein